MAAWSVPGGRRRSDSSGRDLVAIIEKGDGATNYQLMPRDRLVAPREMERKLELILEKLDALEQP